MNSCLYIRRLNVFFSFVGEKIIALPMLKDNATEYMKFGPKYEKLVAKSLRSKNQLKELFGSIKNQGLSK